MTRLVEVSGPRASPVEDPPLELESSADEDEEGGVVVVGVTEVDRLCERRGREGEPVLDAQLELELGRDVSLGRGRTRGPSQTGLIWSSPSDEDDSANTALRRQVAGPGTRPIGDGEETREAGVGKSGWLGAETVQVLKWVWRDEAVFISPDSAG